METYHRVHEAEAEPEAGTRTGFLEPDESGEDMLALPIGNARPVIGHRQMGKAVPCLHRDEHLCRAALIRRAVFQGVVDQVRQSLPDEFAIRLDEDTGLGPGLDCEAVVLREGLIEFPDPARRGAKIEGRHDLTGAPGFQAGDGQQRVEDADEPISLIDHRFKRRPQLVSRACPAQGIVGTVPEASQRRLQVVGDVVGDFPHALHQFADSLEHLVEVRGEPVEFIAIPRDGQPVVEVARHDRPGRAGHRVHPGKDPARREPSADDAQHDHRAQRRCESPADHRAKPVALLRVPPDEETEAARQGEDLDDGEMLIGVRFAAPVADLALAGLGQDRSRNRRHVADDMVAVGGGHEIEGGPWFAGASFDNTDEAAQPAAVVLLGKAVDLGIDRRDDLVVEDGAGVPRNVAEGEEGTEGKDREIRDRQLERCRAEQLGDAGNDRFALSRLGGQEWSAHTGPPSSARST